MVVEPSYAVDTQLDVKVPMRDGVNLSADIYLPRAHNRFPTVLIRTPYSNNTNDMIQKARRLANNGYACVVQDTRGRWDSEGEYYPFHPEAADGYDSQEWIGSQPWSSGKIGMSGASYLGLVQWLSAPMRNQFLTCLAPRVIAGDFYDGVVHPGGAVHLNVMGTWGMRTSGRTAQSIDDLNWAETFHTLPLSKFDQATGRDLQFWTEWMKHENYDNYWDTINVEKKWHEIVVPAFNMSGWFDLYGKHAFTNFNGLRQQGGSSDARRSKVIVGPWTHLLSVSQQVGDIDFGTHSLANLEAMEMRWFDHWLKGTNNGIVDEPPVRIFVMGINRWRDEHEWPLARTDWQRWYMHSAGKANSLQGDGQLNPELPGDEPSDHFVYNPHIPVQTLGGATCCNPELVPWGPRDQRPAEARSDVLRYTSNPLPTNTEITGPIMVVLYAITDARDTDWTAKLVDVWPSGYAMNLCDGIIRARFREGFGNPTLLTPNKIYKYEIDLAVTSMMFGAGHRIRVEISSSNFPRFDRNLNTGASIATGTEIRVARQEVKHSRAHPSHIILPVIPTN